MATQLSTEHKNRIGCKITLKIAEAIKTRGVPEVELPEICNFVLVALDTINTHEEMTHFLKTLSQRWNLFSQVVSEELNQLVADEMQAPTDLPKLT